MQQQQQYSSTLLQYFTQFSMLFPQFSVNFTLLLGMHKLTPSLQPILHHVLATPSLDEGVRKIRLCFANPHKPLGLTFLSSLRYPTGITGLQHTGHFTGQRVNSIKSLRLSFHSPHYFNITLTSIFLKWYTCSLLCKRGA